MVNLWLEKKFQLNLMRICFNMKCKRCHNFIYGNKNRCFIIKEISYKELTISEIQKNLKLNYKTVWKHIQTMKKFGIVELKQLENVTGKPIMVKLSEGLTKLMF